MTLDTSGTIRFCDAGGNVLRRSSGKGTGDRPDDVHHVIWTSIKGEAKRRGVSVDVVLEEKRAERPGQALTLWQPDATAAPALRTPEDLPAPETLPHSYHPEQGVILPERTVRRQALAASILGNETKHKGVESRELVSRLLDDRGDGMDRCAAFEDLILESQREAGRASRSV